MRYWENYRPLQISLILSLLLHLLLFAYFYYAPHPFKAESTPISVEFLPVSREDAEVKKASVALKKTVTLPRPHPLEIGKSVEAPAPRPLQDNAPVEEGKAAQPHPLEVGKTPPFPGRESLIPSMDRLAKIGEGAREEGKDEETVSLDSTDLKYTSYLYGVKRKIEGIWRYPEAGRKAALQGRGLISFTIHRDGGISDLKLLTSSGYSVLDEEILNAVRTASPFNPMADNMEVKRLNIVATFEYNLVVMPYLY